MPIEQNSNQSGLQACVEAKAHRVPLKGQTKRVMQQPPPNPHSTGPQQALPPQQFPRGHHHHSPHPHMHQPPPHSLPPQGVSSASVVTQVNPQQQTAGPPGQQPRIRFIYQIQPQGQEAGNAGTAAAAPPPQAAPVFMQPSTANNFMVNFVYEFLRIS